MIPESTEINNTDDKEIMQKAIKMAEDEKWCDVVNLLRSFRETGQLSNDGLDKLAYCLSRNGDFSEAAKIYEELCQKQPSELMHYYHLAYQYRMIRKWELAIKQYEKCIELFPRFLKPYLELGRLHQEHENFEMSIKAYREGIQAYKKMGSTQQRNYSSLYSKLCTGAAKLIMSSFQLDDNEKNEIEFYLKESISYEPEDPHTWYRLGDFLIKTGKPAEALEYLKKAQSIAPDKEYIPHKMAQSYLNRGELEKAHQIYKQIPANKRPAYILNGIGKCAFQLGNFLEAARYFFRASRKEPTKFYHYRDLGLALIELGDRDQAIKTLEKSNSLYKKEHGKDFNKILEKIDEIKEMNQGDHVVLEETRSIVSTISHGIIVKYKADKGFGFIKDNNDGQDVFFHITRVKNKGTPVEGNTVKFLREVGKKGPQASKVWIQDSY